MAYMHGPAVVASQTVSPLTKSVIKLLVNTAKNIDSIINVFVHTLTICLDILFNLTL